MSDIPEAYLEKARLVVFSAHPQENLAHVIARALMEAVEAERERCTRLARSFELASDSKFDSCVSRARNGKKNLELAAATAAGMAHAAREIAAAICAGGEPA